MSDASLEPSVVSADRHVPAATASGSPPLRSFSLEVPFFLPAPPTHVWQALVDDVDRWWTYRLRERTRIVLEGRVGGQWRQEWDNGGALFGTIVVFDPPRLLSVTGALAMTEPAENRVDVELEAVHGGTRVVVRHAAFGLFDEGAGAIYESGWRELIGSALALHLER
jgi:uncharacterized protein YndB with AHSA1/START domain